MGWRRGEEGVSEVVATTLLVGVTVLAVAIVAAIVLSAPQPGEIPHAAIVAKNESGKFGLAHEGGDPLRVGEYRIYVADGGGLVDKTGNFSSPEGGVWGIGEDIAYNGNSTDFHRVIVTTLVGGGGEVILTEVRLRGGGGFDPDPVKPPEEDPEEPEEPEEFIDFVVNESVFVYGSALQFSGGNVNGPGATVIITGGLVTTDANQGASINVSNIYFDGDVTLSSGSASLGSRDEPGSIYINGSLTLGHTNNRHIYGDVYVAGDFDLERASIHGNVSVDGDLNLTSLDINSPPWIADDVYIYYTGTFTYTQSTSQAIRDKCIKQATVPGFAMPDLEIPPVKSPDTWYTSRGYDTTNVPLTDGVKIFVDSYSYKPSGDLNAEDVIVIAKTGDICIEKWGGHVKGVFFAPKGKVTFIGDSLEGVVIARDGFFVTSGGTQVTFKNIGEYITDPEDYPF